MKFVIRIVHYFQIKIFNLTTPKKNLGFVCTSASRLVLHIWSRKKPRIRRQLMILVEFNKIVCTKKALNVTTIEYLSSYWHYVYRLTMFVCMYIWIQAHNGQTKSSHHVTCYLFITRLFHFINKYSIINKNE